MSCVAVHCGPWIVHSQNYKEKLLNKLNKFIKFIFFDFVRAMA